MFKVTVALLLLISGFLGLGCGAGVSSGSGSQGSTEPQWNSYSVATASALPTCSGDIVGRLYYVEDQAIFRVCKTTGWTTIALGSKISSVVACGLIGGSRIFTWTITAFNNGDKFVSCGILATSIEISKTQTFSSSSSGAVTESCSLVYDLDAASVGVWNFAKSGSSRTVTYQDSGSASNGTSYSFGAGDCTVTNY